MSRVLGVVTLDKYYYEARIGDGDMTEIAKRERPCRAAHAG